MNRNINKKIKEPLSNIDLDDYAKEINQKPANIKLYTDIKKMNNPNQIFQKNNQNYNHCIIFLENQDKKNPVGHWVMCFVNHVNKNEVYFFDSYGESVKLLCPKLVDLLFKKFDKINFNRIKYQEFGDDSATCGRHCILQVGFNNIFKNHNFDNLKKIMDYLKHKYNLKTYNQVVSKLVDISL